MKRREFLGVLGGAVALPIAVQAQGTRIARVGVLLPGSPTGQYGEYLPSFQNYLYETCPVISAATQEHAPS